MKPISGLRYFNVLSAGPANPTGGSGDHVPWGKWVTQDDGTLDLKACQSLFFSNAKEGVQGNLQQSPYLEYPLLYQ